MSRMKKWSLLFMAMTLMCLAMMLGGCSGNKPYKVTVKDALGNPYTSGVVVQFLQDGKQVGMQPCNEKGVAEKELEKGDYEIALMFTDDSVAYYYEEGAKVTAKEKETEVILAYKIDQEAKKLYVQDVEFEAYDITEGCTYVELNAEKRNYFLFTPSKAGTYEFSIADGADVTIGYYGAPHYVQENSAAEVTNNKFTSSVSAGMIGDGSGGTSTYVIGVDVKNENAKTCVIGIENIGEAKYGIEDEPWNVYKKTSELAAYTLPAGANVQKFDIKASDDQYKLVMNEEDGFYHLDSADGPLVVVYLAEDPEYVSCFKTILEHTGIRKYFYDKDGEFEKKEEYSECVMEYLEYVDEKSGLYPLTEDLKYIIQQFGDQQGWWDTESHSYIFVDEDRNNIPGINAEIAWLFMCGYIN